MSELLTLHRSLYRPEAVSASAAAFAGLARIEVEPLESEIRIRFDEVDPDVHEVLLDAFANHALAETVRLHRATRGEDPRDATAGVG